MMEEYLHSWVKYSLDVSSKEVSPEEQQLADSLLKQVDLFTLLIKTQKCRFNIQTQIHVSRTTDGFRGTMSGTGTFPEHHPDLT